MENRELTSQRLPSHQQVGIVIYVSDGSFDRGFRVRFNILSNGSVVSGQRDLRLPPAPSLPSLYQSWRESYFQMGIGPDATMVMAPIQAVQNQTTHSSVINDCEQTTRQLEATLKTWFAQQEFMMLDALIRGESIVHSDQSVPVIFDFDTGESATDEQLRKLPWHQWSLLRNTLTNAEMVFSTGSYHQVPPLTLPAKVLVVLGSSEGGLALEKDKRAWEALENKGAQLTIVDRPSLEILDRQLRSHSWDILFFAGHSSSKQDTLDDGYLQISDTETIRLEVLDESLRRAVQKGLKLAIFNSCDGLGLASFLARLAVPFSIVMREPVPDVIAREFLKIFLGEFSQGKPLYLSMREARSRLKWRQGDPKQSYPCATWLPILCQSPTQPELFWPTAQPDLPEPPPAPIESTGVSSPPPKTPNQPFPRKLAAAVGGFAAVGLAALAWWLLPGGSQEKVKYQPISSIPNDAFSLGEEFLLTGPYSGPAQAGADAFRDQDYAQAITLFRSALNDNRNNPEVLIYLNNAIAAASGQPIDMVAVSIPARDADGDSKELLRGIAQAQTEHNCGIAAMLTAIENPASLESCQPAGTLLQVMIADHDNRNDADRVIERFEQLATDGRILGVLGRYNSSMTFAVEQRINEGIKIPVISTTSTAVRQTEIPSRYVFRTSPTDDMTARKWQDYLDNNSARHLVMLSDSGDNSEYSQSLRTELENILPTSIKAQSYNCDLSDISLCLNELEEQPVDAIVLIPSDDRDYIDQALSFVDRFESRYSGTPLVLGGDTLYNSQQVLERISQNSLLESLVVAVPWHRGQQPTAFEQAAERLWQSAINWRTAMGYDATQLLITAAEQITPCGNDVQSCRGAIRDSILADGLDGGATGDIQFRNNDGNRQVSESSRISVLVGVNLAERTFECLEGESCAE